MSGTEKNYKHVSRRWRIYKKVSNKGAGTLQKKRLDCKKRLDL